ncbi:MAG: hypothetical protein ACRC2T_14635, partial [Thermoguttaceae bacterium]
MKPFQYKTAFLVSLQILLATLFVATAFSADLTPSDMKAWRTLPVYDDGRVMPLNTFARQVVNQICGSHRVHLLRDEVSKEDIAADLAKTFKGDPRDAAKEVERIQERIEQIIPENGRYFEPYELLLAWMLEPEIWEYIPFLTVDRPEFRQDVLALSLLTKSGKKFKHVSPKQVESSKSFAEVVSKVREKQMKAAQEAQEAASTMPQRRQKPREVSPPAVAMTPDETTASHLYSSFAAYRTLTHRPDTILHDLPNSFVSYVNNAQTSFGNVSRNWSRVTQLGLFRKTNLKSEVANAALLREKVNAIALLLAQLRKYNDHEFALTPPTLARVETQLDILLSLIDELLTESESLIDGVYASTDSSIAGSRTDVISLHASLLSLRRYVQAAYLSLFQTGQTLRVLPTLFDDGIRPTPAPGADMAEIRDLGPWTPLSMLVAGGPRTIRRFVDRDYPVEADTVDESNLLDSDFKQLINSEIKSKLITSSKKDASTSDVVYTQDKTAASDKTAESEKVTESD